jgi:hypothetical protein
MYICILPRLPVFLLHLAAKAAKVRADKLAADKAAADGLEIFLSCCRRYTSIETQFHDAIRKPQNLFLSLMCDRSSLCYNVSAKSIKKRVENRCIHIKSLYQITFLFSANFLCYLLCAS